MKEKFLFILFIFICIVPISSALKISPTQSTLEINQYETNCTDIWVLPHEDFVITSKWTYDGKGNLSNYILDNKKIGLEINYSYISEGKYKICFTPNGDGNLSGIIYFYSEKTMIEIGSWVELKIHHIGAIERASMITANVIKESGTSSANLFLGIIFISLLAVFLFLLKNFFKKKTKNNFNRKEFSEQKDFEV
jgi:hypothetical protein